MKNPRIIVVGGSAAGPKAASKARRVDENAEITIFQKGSDLSMASCGYPYYVGGYFDDRDQLLCSPAGVVRDSRFFWNAKKITTKVNTLVTKIDPQAKKIYYTDLISGEKGEAEYDKLILSTGATAKKPPIPGIELEGITTLQTLSDADYLRKIHDEKIIKKAILNFCFKIFVSLLRFSADCRPGALLPIPAHVMMERTVSWPKRTKRPMSKSVCWRLV